MEPTPPFWFKQRQCRLEGLGDDRYKITGPNLNECSLRVFSEGGRWKAALRTTPDAPDADLTTDSFASVRDAWSAAFELFRNRFIV
jgi:hypothetical protein